MTISVGIAISSRRATYRPTSLFSPVPHPGVRTAWWWTPPRRRTAMSIWLLAPVLDVVHLGVPWARVDALQALRHTAGRVRAVDERDVHDVLGQDVVQLDRDLRPLRAVELLLELVEQLVVVRVRVPVVVTELPVVRLARELRRDPAREVRGRVHVAAVGEHLDVGPEVVRAVGRGVREEHVGRDGLQVHLEPRLLPARLQDVLRLLAQRVDRGLVRDLEPDAALRADAVGSLDPARVLELLARRID